MGGEFGCRSLAPLGWLYMVQGIPYGLQDKFLPVQLRSIGLNYSSVSLLKLLLLPWIAKGIWAPVVEVYGGKQRWLLISTLGLGVSSLAGSMIAPDDVVSLGVMLLSLNLCSAVQDVAVDGMALQVLSDDQLSLGNTLQVVLYKVGCLVGGAGLSFLLMYSNWTVTFTILAFTYMVTSVWVCSLSFNRNISAGKVVGSKKYLSTEKTLHSHLHIERIFSIIKEVLSSTGTLWISLYVVLYKMGERGAINNMPLYLLDKGFPKESLSFWNGTVCQGLSVLGSIYGGVTLRKLQSDIRAVIMRYSIHRCILIFIECILIFLLDQHSNKESITTLHYISIASLCLLSFTSGVISTATFTFMMTKSRGCSPESQTSHYSLLASVEVAGKLIFASLAGFGIDSFGMFWTFSLFAFLSILPVLVIYIAPSHLYANIKQE
ncbi:major facilitator superfamily domain-containing protein 3-like isoform X1 [Eriocheir sinensis]|uniref:major facilitator superfamily domain-containing protein 3-like isoform X1 n=1 Tax=Eriocheir sinensis TaxID=95602 RepID=UPI0021C83D9F|nr:major facilitator superfamily domain-containing protein 3-like isoform X1 [Eriocheir sinensis]